MVKASSQLHKALLSNILRQPMARFFDRTPVGRIINRFSRDLDMVDSQMPRSVRMFLQQLFAVLGVLAVISFTMPAFLFAVFPLMYIYYLVKVCCLVLQGS